MKDNQNNESTQLEKDIRTNNKENKLIPYHNPIYLYITYIIAIICWSYIIWYFKLLPSFFSLRQSDNQENIKSPTANSLIAWFLILLPFLSFIIAIYSADSITKDVENFAFNANLLTLGMIVALPLLNWLAERYTGDRTTFTQMLALAIVLSMLTLLDFWVKPPYLCLIKHIKSALQTMAIILMTLAIYIFFIDIGTNGFKQLSI